MSMSNPANSHLWSIVLAGGEGRRIRPFVEQWLGYPLPKQYCTFVGSRSMLQHTWARSRQVTTPARQVTVVARDHRQHAMSDAGQDTVGQVILQPDNRDTGAGMFLPLTYIRTWDPQATIVVFPSDHFVFPEDRFVESVQRAIQATTIFQDRIMLLGARPTCLELDYGWIEPGAPLGWSGGHSVRRVDTFLEKPDAIRALAALSNGALWNTFVMAATVETFWNLGWKYMPEVMDPFQRLQEAIGTPEEGRTLEAIYRDMPRRDFSTHLLAAVPESVGVIELNDAMWSDWGRPERIAETLRVIGKEPAFLKEHLRTHHLVEVAS